MECNKKVALRGGIKKKGRGAAGVGRSAMEKKEAEKSMKNENRRDSQRERERFMLSFKERDKIRKARGVFNIRRRV